jgi:Rod binding domain-containing protein
MSATKGISDKPIYHGINLPDKEKPKSLDQQKPIDDRQYIPKQYQEVAESMEQQFADYMLQQMNKTTGEEDADGSGGMDYYKSLQTSERAKAMAQQNNLGLQGMILDQIYPKRMRNEMALKQYEAQANRIHNNLPSYKIEKKTDTIVMGKNESSPVSDDLVQKGHEEGVLNERN